MTTGLSRFAGGPVLTPGLDGVDLKCAPLCFHPERDRRADRAAVGSSPLTSIRTR